MLRIPAIPISLAPLLFGCWGLVAAEDWRAPADAAGVANPVASSADAIGSGGHVYHQSCAVCHGESGKGDGPGGMYLVPKPTDLTAAAFTAQSDGAMFWKLGVGRNAMVEWKTLLTDKQRWELVLFMRTLGH
jgi:mono/diheme cytochrome c family protein